MACTPDRLMLSRRGALLGLTAAVSLGRASLALAGAPTDRRFVVVMLRGAMDGLSAVVPYGDAALAAWRPALIPPAPGQDGGLLDLGGFYGLNPVMTGMHTLYGANQMLAVHAVAGSWRVRSHFEAQDYMEFGADHRLTSGWLNRVAGLVPRAGASETALSVAPSTPLLLRGPAPVGQWLPQSFQRPDPDLYSRIAELHSGDSVTGPAIREALRDRGFSATALSGIAEAPNKYAFPALAASAGRLLAAADGPRLAAMEVGGWDTHTGQMKRLDDPLRQLDQGMVALRTGLGDAAWNRTVVLVMTEFGRTVRANGTGGTDHGTGTVAFVLGGAVAGGRVVANWPGLGQDHLLENRDLQPTADLRSVAKGLLAAHLGLDGPALSKVFPESQMAAAMRGLVTV